ncbi:non-canonical poly(A) RNA polymerase PAPD5/7 [Marchantia polymorpha subsp. ruderalis]|uniref:Polymerase nucleotidyl transferase domain-containing protein n=2 Tax=Marchantia polymorpha TaxID=3197 RepID=A0AAF6BT47_MARPO|nr:hypothetical protein MARPO_0145s0022 [Marchantia polymorpha]PTQ29256.1 hypothetical protein MARPO_0145s0022 [Marchantia polymorpha]BBN15180.1 hypothetical protein Mp_6g17640 [Marchantia polymorpha subsp. ruderalis]BBN15181.1 hypothetical protein Mp_6g17640 [Marchantia polymorpha subsp. ruderalis]|eukprot:PTQ29255.1 hypothetical protein MARPO_0145s0022 [Marchantia polymorpha]
MGADTLPWISAISSESEDDDRPSGERRYSAIIRVAKSEVYSGEDDDVQILNVSKTEIECLDLDSDNSVPQNLDHELSASLLNSTGLKEVFQFVGTSESTTQQISSVSARKKKKNEARQQRRERAILRRQEKEANGADMPLNFSDEPERREAEAQARRGPSASTGLGFIDMERLVTGSNTLEWCNSLRMCQGPEQSNLHWNVVKFCNAHELTPEQIDIRRDALEYVKQAVYEIWPSAEVHLFGSTATGLALPWSDIDVAVMSPMHSGTWQKPSTMSWLSALSRNLKRHGQCKKIRPIPFAKVPLLKVVFTTGLACDISFDVPNGPRGVPVIREFMQHFEALRPLCLVLKYFLGQKDLNELYTGGIGSFCLINMVVSHLQNLGVHGSGHDLGVLLLSFFNHYGIMHDYRSDVVCTRPGYCAPKPVRGWVKASDPDLLSCEDPLDPTSDIAKGSYRIHDAKRVFLKAKTALLAHWHDEDVLAQLIDTSQPPSGVKPKPQSLTSTPASTPTSTPASTPASVGKKKQKQKKRKMKNRGVSSSDDEEDTPSEQVRKRQKFRGKSVEQVSDSKRRRLSTVQRPAKLQKKKKRKQKLERIYLDFWGNHVNTKPRRTGKAARKGRS